MSWNLDSDRPIYAQIVEIVEMQIVSGIYAPGEKLPSVRNLAMEANVNPNTMQKALSELEKSGLIITQRTSGRVVTEDISMIQATRKHLAVGEVRAFLEKMKLLGFDQEMTCNILEELLKGEKQ